MKTLLQPITFVAMATLAFGSMARCIDEDAVAATPSDASAAVAPAAEDPRSLLAGLVRTALDRSQAVGAAKLMAEAAVDDVAVARAAKEMQVTLTAGLGPSASQSLGVRETSALQARAGLNVSQTIYDGGRNDRLTDWRSMLAESARMAFVTQQERLAASTVALALERSRFRQHSLIYGQYVRKMGCLVESLEAIVRADRGRASELVQARKSMQQAELAQSQAQAQARQVEVRLRRMVGDGLPGTAGLSTVLLQVPPLPDLLVDAERAPELAQLAAAAAAADRLADATAAAAKPQVGWTFGSTVAAGFGGTTNNKSGSFGLGVNISIPLISPGQVPSTEAARKRAQAAVLQRADALESRLYRMTEMHDQTQASFDRARRVAEVLRDSEQVRNYTLQQWQQLGKRSLFDVMGAEADHYNLRVSYVNALHDGQQMNAVLLSLGRGVAEWLQ